MQIALDIPDRYLLDRSPAQLAQQIRLYAALLMFESGELSAGAAAEFAEVDRWSFAQACTQHGIPLIAYTSEDLSAELQSLRKAS